MFRINLFKIVAQNTDDVINNLFDLDEDIVINKEIVE
jgi:hypothetical protein